MKIAENSSKMAPQLKNNVEWPECYILDYWKSWAKYNWKRNEKYSDKLELIPLMININSINGFVDLNVKQRYVS